MERLEELSEAEQHAIMTILARRLRQTLTEMGFEVPSFVLLHFNDPRRCRYIANCSPSVLIQALRATADWLEHHPNVTH